MNDEQVRGILAQVSHYINFEDYKENGEDLDSAKEDFANAVEEGSIQEITLGTYNGALDIFTPRKIDDSHILDAILTDLHETESYAMIDDIEGESNMTQLDYIEVYSNLRNIYVLNNKIYIERP